MMKSLTQIIKTNRKTFANHIFQWLGMLTLPAIIFFEIPILSLLASILMVGAIFFAAVGLLGHFANKEFCRHGSFMAFKKMKYDKNKSEIQIKEQPIDLGINFVVMLMSMYFGLTLGVLFGATAILQNLLVIEHLRQFYAKHLPFWKQQEPAEGH